jgi:hypothetical protein
MSNLITNRMAHANLPEKRVVINVIDIIVLEDHLKTLRLPNIAGSMGWTSVFSSSGKVLLRNGCWNGVPVH